MHAGECVAVIGPNGAGKTTLIATLAGLRAPAAGTIAYDGTPLERSPRARGRGSAGGSRRTASITFPRACWKSRSPAGIRTSRATHGSPPPTSNAPRRRWPDSASPSFAARDVRTLSGGERRRVALAALVAQAPRLMLLDEPSSHLDPGHQVAALDALTALARAEGKAIVMALHELHLAVRYADHVVALADGRASVGRADEMLTAARLSQLFGTPLVAAGDGRARTFVPA